MHYNHPGTHERDMLGHYTVTVPTPMSRDNNSAAAGTAGKELKICRNNSLLSPYDTTINRPVEGGGNATQCNSLGPAKRSGVPQHAQGPLLHAQGSCNTLRGRATRSGGPVHAQGPCNMLRGHCKLHILHLHK